MISVTADQRALLDQARAKRLSDMRSASGSRLMQHVIDAQAQVTDLTASNAMGKERAIEEFFSEGGKVTTRSNQWKAHLISVTADQRLLLEEA